MNIIRNNRVPQRLIAHIRNHSNASVAQKRLIIEHLDQRQLVRVCGEDVISFLQGLTTCDMRQLESSLATSIYSMFLNKAGRVLYDAIMYRISSDPTAILIECDKDITNDLMRHLKLYRVRRKIQIDSIMDEYKLWSVFDPLADASTNICSIQVPTNMNGVEITHDPRLIALGHRIVSSSDKASSDISKMYTDIGKATVEPSSSTSNYRLYRYNLGVAEGVLDMPPGKQFPLEANCDLLNGVSFNKGCYIGQELTARVHHTGVIRKRHMPIQLNTPLAANSSMAVHKEDGTKIGNILGSVADRALGLLRIEHVLKSKELTVDGKPCHIEKPKWWPPSLFSNVSIKD